MGVACDTHRMVRVDNTLSWHHRDLGNKSIMIVTARQTFSTSVQNFLVLAVRQSATLRVGREWSASRTNCSDGVGEAIICMTNPVFIIYAGMHVFIKQ